MLACFIINLLFDKLFSFGFVSFVKQYKYLYAQYLKLQHAGQGCYNSTFTLCVHKIMSKPYFVLYSQNYMTFNANYHHDKTTSCKFAYYCLATAQRNKINAPKLTSVPLHILCKPITNHYTLRKSRPFMLSL